MKKHLKIWADINREDMAKRPFWHRRQQWVNGSRVVMSETLYQGFVTGEVLNVRGTRS